jgi:hypothetical protein
MIILKTSIHIKFALLTLLLVVAIHANGSWSVPPEQPWTSGATTVTLDDNGILRVSGKGAMENYGRDAYPRPPWFDAALYRVVPQIISVIIDEGVTHVGDRAFQSFRGSSWLRSVTIPGSVTSIGDQAFMHVKSLRSVTIPNSVMSIGKHAFYNTGLTSVTIPISVISIGTKAFVSDNLVSINVDKNNPRYSSIDGVLFNKTQDTLMQYPAAKQDDLYTIPSSVVFIGDKAFISCRNLISVIIPNGVTHIGNHAFTRAFNLTSITIPNSVISIGDAAFSHCKYLTSITIPNSVTSIGARAFWSAGLTSVTLPNSMTSIETGVFEDCRDLKFVDIPNTVTSIGKDAFVNCHNLTSVTIPNTVTRIEHRAFSGTGLTSITIPSSVTDIESFAFHLCSSLTSVTIQNSKQITIGEGAFYGISSDACLYVPANLVKAYRAWSDNWKAFYCIKPIKPTVFIGGRWFILGIPTALILFVAIFLIIKRLRKAIKRMTG